MRIASLAVLVAIGLVHFKLSVSAGLFSTFRWVWVTGHVDRTFDQWNDWSFGWWLIKGPCQIWVTCSGFYTQLWTCITWKSILLLTLYKQLFKITACQTILYANDLKFATMFCFLISNSVKCYTIKCWQMVPKLRLYNQLLSRLSNAEYICR